MADPDQEVYRAYGVQSAWAGFFKGSPRLGQLISAARAGFLPGKMEGSTALIPADFLIGPDLVVQRTYYGRDIGDHLPLEELDAWLGPRTA